MCGIVDETVKELLSRLEEIVMSEAIYASETCSGCKLCINACPSYRASGNKLYTPYERLRRALRIIKNGRLEPNDLEILFTCTMCGACSLLCPYSIRIWLLVWWSRYIIARRSGLPRGLAEVRVNAQRAGHTYFNDRGKAVKLLKRVAVANGLKVDEPSRYLLVPSPLELTVYPQTLKAKANLIGDNASLSTKALDFGGNVVFDASSPDIGLGMMVRCLEAGEELGVESIVVSECGSDTKLATLIGRLAVRRWGGIRLQHFYEIVKPRVNNDVTVFTSCNFCRFPGPCIKGVKTPRDRPPATMCCGAGGGLALNQESWARSVRRKVARLRLSTLKSTHIVVHCVKCLSALKEASLLEKKIVRVETIAEYMAKRVSGEEVKAG